MLKGIQDLYRYIDRMIYLHWIDAPLCRILILTRHISRHGQTYDKRCLSLAARKHFKHRAVTVSKLNAIVVGGLRIAENEANFSVTIILNPI
jgi:hypothetical protein